MKEETVFGNFPNISSFLERKLILLFHSSLENLIIDKPLSYFETGFTKEIPTFGYKALSPWGALYTLHLPSVPPDETVLSSAYTWNFTL